MWKRGIWVVLAALAVGMGGFFSPRGMAQQSYPLEPFQCPAGQFTYAFNPVTGGLPGWFCATPGVAKQIVTPPATTVGDLAVWGNTNGTSLIDNGTAFPSITVANNNALKALPVPTAGTVAYRAGFASAGDGGNATYTFASSNCSISGGDNGYESQPNIGTGCWIASIPVGGLSTAVWGMNTALADNSTVFQTALTTALSNNIPLYIPAGTFNFTNPVSGTIPGGQSFTLMGAGQDVTILKYTGSSGLLTLNYTNEHAGFTNSDLTYLANSAGAGTGLNLVQLNGSIGNEAGSATTNLTSMTFRGGLGAGTTNYWTTAFAEQGISNINFTNDTVFLGTAGSNGDAFSLSGASITSQSVAINFSGVNVAGGRYGIIYGNFVQGVDVVNSNIDQDLHAIYVNGTAQGTVLNVSNSQFGGLTGNTIDIVGTLNGATFNGNSFVGLHAGLAGIALEPAGANGLSNYVISNNTFSPAGGVTTAMGVAATGNGAALTTVTVSNNQFIAVEGVEINAANANIFNIIGNTMRVLSGGVTDAIDIEQMLNNGFATNIQGNNIVGYATGINIASTGGTIVIGPNTYSNNTTNLVNNDDTKSVTFASAQAVAGSTSSVPVVGGGSDVYMAIGSSGTTVETNASALAGKNQVIAFTACSVDTQPGAGQTVTFTLRVSLASTGLTCTVTGASNFGIVAGSPIVVGPGSVWDILAHPSSGAASTVAHWTGTLSVMP